MQQNEHECNECKYNPNSHSFHFISQNDNEKYYYTCPLDFINYNDPEGFLKHVDIELKYNIKPWIWIINFECFGISQLKHRKMNYTIINIIEYYSKYTLKNVIIINQTFSSRCLIDYMWYRYLSKEIKDLIIFDKNNNFSKLLLIDQNMNLLNLNLTF